MADAPTGSAVSNLIAGVETSMRMAKAVEISTLLVNAWNAHAATQDPTEEVDQSVLMAGVADFSAIMISALAGPNEGHRRFLAAVFQQALDNRLEQTSLAQ